VGCGGSGGDRRINGFPVRHAQTVPRRCRGTRFPARPVTDWCLLSLGGQRPKMASAWSTCGTRERFELFVTRMLLARFQSAGVVEVPTIETFDVFIHLAGGRASSDSLRAGSIRRGVLGDPRCTDTQDDRERRRPLVVRQSARSEIPGTGRPLGPPSRAAIGGPDRPGSPAMRPWTLGG
jgi:hypothetical protein